MIHVIILENKRNKDDSACCIKNTVGRSKSRSRNKSGYYSSPRKREQWLGQECYGEGEKFMDWEAESTEFANGLNWGRKKKRKQSFGLKNEVDKVPLQAEKRSRLGKQRIKSFVLSKST